MKKAYFHTFGCKVNQYDTQLLREGYLAQGYGQAASADESDLVVINTCTVTAEADRQVRQLVRQLHSRNPGANIRISGCYAVRAQDELKKLFPYAEIDGAQIQPAGGIERAISSFDGHSRAFVKVQDGCDSCCSYCIVPSVRPRLQSKSPDTVISEVKSLIGKGYPEIVLTGTHLGKYEGGVAGLVRRLIDVEGRFRIRLSSLEMNEVSDDLLDLFKKYPVKICRHLHIPLQSGSDRILERMNRRYRSADFSRTLARLRERLPDAGISTDVIVGFPGETNEDFRETRDILASGGFSRLHVFRFSPRTGTPAAAMPDQVPAPVAAERARDLRGLDLGLQKAFFRQFIGTQRTAVFEGKKGSVLTDNYLRLTVNGGDDERGLLTVRVGEVKDKPWGEIVSSR